MKEFIKRIAPPGLEKPNRKRVFDFIARLGQIAADDALKDLRNFFPFLADRKALAAHGKALSIPRYSNDTDELYRQRVATAMYFIKQRGTRGFFKTAIAQRFENRGFEIIEEFLHLTVKILDMTEKDRAWLYEFLEAELDPNILINLVDWFRWVERIESEDEFSVSLYQRLVEAWDYGLTLDGRVLLDHGESLLLNGKIKLEGTQDLKGYRGKKGTWTGFRYEDLKLTGFAVLNGEYNLSALIKLPAEKRDEAVTLGSGTSCDELVITINKVKEAV